MPYGKHCFIIVNTQKSQDSFFFWPIGVSPVNISWAIINSGLKIKPGTKLLDLNDKCKANLRNGSSGLKCLIVDELSLVSSNLWTDIDSRLGELFLMILEKAFADLSVMTVGNFLQLPPVRIKLVSTIFWKEWYETFIRFAVMVFI